MDLLTNLTNVAAVGGLQLHTSTLANIYTTPDSAGRVGFNDVHILEDMSRSSHIYTDSPFRDWHSTNTVPRPGRPAMRRGGPGGGGGGPGGNASSLRMKRRSVNLPDSNKPKVARLVSSGWTNSARGKRDKRVMKRVVEIGADGRVRTSTATSSAYCEYHSLQLVQICKNKYFHIRFKRNTSGLFLEI